MNPNENTYNSNHKCIRKPEPTQSAWNRFGILCAFLLTLICLASCGKARVNLEFQNPSWNTSEKNIFYNIQMSPAGHTISGTNRGGSSVDMELDPGVYVLTYCHGTSNEWSSGWEYNDWFPLTVTFSAVKGLFSPVENEWKIYKGGYGN